MTEDTQTFWTKSSSSLLLSQGHFPVKTNPLPKLAMFIVEMEVNKNKHEAEKWSAVLEIITDYVGFCTDLGLSVLCLFL